jgi:hypothetical protein
MHIERLRLVVEEAEASLWANRFLENLDGFSNPRIAFEMGTVKFQGQVRIPLAGEVPFGTIWTIQAQPDGVIEIQLKKASVFGWSGGSGFLSGMIMERIRNHLKDRPGFKVSGDRILLDPAVLLALLPVDVRVRLTAVTLEPGRLVLESA